MHDTQEDIMKVWVVFTGETEIPALKVLRKGFRHCYTLMHDGEHWMSMDPLSNHTDIQRHHVPGDFDLPQWLESRGYTIIEAELNRSHIKMAPVLPFTCVEAVKRFLGIHSWTILTPYQLYKYFVSESEKSLPDPQQSIYKEIYHGKFFSGPKSTELYPV